MFRDTTADGNCLFRAISDQIWGSEVHHHRIRRDCVQFMKDYEDDFKPFIDGDFDAFLRETSTLGEFAGNEVNFIHFSCSKLIYCRPS